MRRAPTLVAAALIALAAWGLAGCSGDPDSGDGPRRVLVLVLDSTHAEHLGSYGDRAGLTPHLDALAERGRRFSNARSNNTWTLASTVSLMTGQLQERHGVVTNHHRVGEDMWLLSEHFRDAGWQTAAFVEMIYASGVHGLDRGFEHNSYYSIKAGPHPFTLVQELDAWMEEHADERWFAYAHLRRPHSPYDPSAAARLRVEGDCPLADGRHDQLLAHADSRVNKPLPDVQRKHVEHLYRANLSSVNDQLIDVLARAARDPELLVVLTSDHGEALGQHGRYGHGYRLLAEFVDVPLIYAGPGIEPGVDAGPACTVDLVPTLVDLCDLPPVPHPVDGESLAERLRGAPPPERQRPLALSTRYVEGRVPSQGVVLGHYKLVLSPKDEVVLYDLGMDPGEQRNVAELYPAVVERLLPLAQERRRAGRDLATRGTEEFSVDEEELRALGYVR